MKARILQKEKLPELLDVLIKEYEVIAPTRVGALKQDLDADTNHPSGELTYGEVHSASEVYLGDDRPAKSLKGVFFPEREVLVEYVLGKSGGESQVNTPPVETETRVIFGADPCDVAAFPIVDKVFAWDYLDSLYLEARERTVILSMACENPCETCFCTSLGGSPVDIEGSDLLLTPVEGAYHVQIVTERGKALVAKYEQFFGASDQAHDREVVLFEENARKKIQELDLTGLHEKLEFEDSVWETLAPQCIDCGICTFLCPTCHCFDIQDEGSAVEGERVRLWDACTFYNYTKAHAGQPRPTHYRRYRQRIMHKFRYYPENFGRTLCVGCGRCIEYCPVSIDLRQILRRAAKLQLAPVSE